MSSSFIENKTNSNSYIKLIIHETHINPEMNVPLPYGIMISFGNAHEKNIEPINKEKEILKPPLNHFIYYFDKNLFDCNTLKEKEITIYSYTTSIFIIKKNFATVKIPIILNKNDNKKKNWCYLKDINGNICIKLLISIDINIPYFKNKENIININENKKNNLNRANTNYIKNNLNTYLISTNYNSSNGNSLLNLSNYNINNNLSPITFIGKSNSFFFDSKNKQMEKNLKIINNNLNKAKNDKNEEDSIIINDNDIEQYEENDSINQTKEDNVKNEIHNKNNINNNKLKNKISEYNINSDNDVQNKNQCIKKINMLKKDDKQYKNVLKKLEKEKNDNIYNNQKKNLLFLKNNSYRRHIQIELNNYEKTIFENLNNIYNINNNLEQLLKTKIKEQKEKNKTINNITPKKAELYKKIEINQKEKKKQNKKVFPLNKTIPRNPLFIKKLDFHFRTKGNMKNYINSGRKLNNKKCTPINYKFKKFNRKLSSSIYNISNTENIKDESKNQILKTEGKNNAKTINNDSINISKFKKIEKIAVKRKSLKINGNFKIKFYEEENKKKFGNNSNYLKKISFIKINLNKEKKAPNKNLTIMNNKKYSDNNINKNKILQTKTTFKTLDSNNSKNMDKYNTSIGSMLTKNKMNKTTLTKINNLGKKKLKIFDKTKNNYNNRKSLNIDTFKVFNNQIFKGKTSFIKCNIPKNNETKTNSIRLVTNPNEVNKKKNITYRNNLNLSENTILLNFQKDNKSIRDNKRKNSSKKILLKELIK